MTETRPRAAVIQFPGVNCEEESARALAVAGAAPQILRWNEDPARLAEFDAFLLPGGFSYQDRVRAGAVAAKSAILGGLAEAAAAGKPILGICNGAQVLVEAGFVPGLEPETVELALAPNRMRGRRGYFSEWSTLAVPAGGRAWVGELAGTLLPIPFAHAEGRFTSRRKELFADLATRGQIVFRYAGPTGEGAAGRWPDNPNGSQDDVAGICNPAGNVIAMMPHPERATWLGQLPEMMPGPWGRTRQEARGDWTALQGPGPGRGIFRCLVEAARAVGGGN